MVVQEEKNRFVSGTYRYALSQYVAKKVYSVSGTKSTQLKVFTQNSDYILENNEIVWSTTSGRSLPDSNTDFTVIYEYDPILATIDFTEEQYGKDVQILQATNNITSSPSGDLNQVAFFNNFLQAIRHRLLTQKGELYSHPAYGCDLYKLLGQSMTNTTVELARLYVVDAINQDPRVDKILKVDITPERLNNALKISIVLTTIVSHEPLNIVYDYYLEKSGYVYA